MAIVLTHSVSQLRGLAAIGLGRVLVVVALQRVQEKRTAATSGLGPGELNQGVFCGELCESQGTEKLDAPFQTSFLGLNRALYKEGLGCAVSASNLRPGCPQ